MKIIGAIFLTVLFCTIVFANGSNKKQITIPDVVKSTFKKEYPNVKKVKWEAEDSEFEASFKIQKMDASVTYDSAGHKKAFEMETNMNELPVVIPNYLATNYPKTKIKETAIITSDMNVITYEVGIQKSGKLLDLFFDSNGKFLKQIFSKQ